MMYLLSTSYTLSAMFIINFLSIFVIMVVFWTYADAQQITIKADKDSIPKDGRVVLTCSMHNLKIPVAWVLKNVSTDLYIGYNGITCLKDPLSFPAPYTGDCVNSTVYTLTIDPVTSSMRGDTWRCSANDNSGTTFKSTDITIQVTVSITSVTLTPNYDPMNVVTDIPFTLSCVTSESHPAATVSWFKGSENITAFSTSVTTNFLTTSTLIYIPSRADQGKRIRCDGNNGETTVTSSRRPQANIQFGPSVPDCDFAGAAAPSIIRVREGWTFSLECTSSGNPTPSLTWTHPGPGPASPLTFSNIQKIHNGTFIVTSSNTLTPSGGKDVMKSNIKSYTVHVMYPPESILCKVGSASSLGPGTLRVIKGSTFTISCFADSFPASTWAWSWSSGSGSDYQLSVPNIQTEGPFTVIAGNTMTLTNGTETGRNQNEYSLLLLYPPSSPVFYLGGANGHRITGNILSVIRGKSNSVACISTGNPDPTYSSWNGTGQLWTFTANTDFTRICVASNTLDPTGFNNESRSTSNALNIKVMYGASITHFDILGHEGRDEVVLFESSRVSFHCAVDSNPDSFIEILKDGQSLKKVSSAQDLNFVIEESKCEDDGIYTCTGRNVHDSSPAMRTLTVFVKCSPRASAVSPSVHYVTSVTGNPATLNFTYVAFPRPHISDIKWEKQDMPGNGWTIMHSTHSVNIFVSENRLQTTIAFTSVKEVDFGYYRVNVSNELGRTSEIFHLQSQEPGPSAGPVIGGAVGGSIGLIAVIVMIVVILRRKSTLNCNIVGKIHVPPVKSVSGANNPGHNAETHEEISMTTDVLVYDVLDRGEIGLDSTHVYMPLEESSLKSNINYGNLKTE